MSFLSDVTRKFKEYYERFKSQMGLLARDVYKYLLECKMQVVGLYGYVKEYASVVGDKLYYGFRWLRYRYYSFKRNDRVKNIASFLFLETLPYVVGYGLAVAFLASQFFGFSFTVGNVFGMGLAYYFVDNEVPDIVSRLVPWPTRTQVEG